MTLIKTISIQSSVSGNDEEKKWASDLVEHMLKMSPTSMKVTLKQVREGKKLNTLKDCLQMEHRYQHTIPGLSPQVN